MPGTIYLVNVDESARTGMTRLLSLCGNRVHAYETGQQLLDALPRDVPAPACILLDLQMSGLGWLDLLETLCAHDRPPVIMVAAHGDVATSVTAMKHGAADVLEQPVNSAQLRSTVDQALKKHAIDQADALAFAEYRARIESLTCREHEVLRYIISGRLNKVIASELGISEKTVKVHRARVLDKMQVSSVAELARGCALTGLEPVDRINQQPALPAPESRLRLIA